MEDLHTYDPILYDFDFPEAQQYEMIAGQNYIIMFVVKNALVYDDHNYFQVHVDFNTPHSGNYCAHFNGSWVSVFTEDTIFYVYGDPVEVPPYQLTLASDKPAYYTIEPIFLSGILTYEGSPVAGATVTLYRNGVPHLETTTLGDGSYSFEDSAAFEGAVGYYTEHVVADLIFRSNSLVIRKP